MTKRNSMAYRSLTVAVLILIAACLVQPPVIQAQQGATDQRIQAAEAHLRMVSKDAGGYDRLGAAYLQKGRETGDAAYYELAKKSFQQSLDLQGTDVRAATSATYMAV